MLPLDEISPIAVERHGGKATNLARLNSKGFQIPSGFSISSNNFSLMITRITEIEITIAQIERTEDFEEIIILSEKIQHLIDSYEIPEQLQEEIEKQYLRIYKTTENIELGCAVRSSATIEDRNDISFAGQAETHLCIRGVQQIIDAMKQVWKSSFSPGAVIYLKTKNIPLSKVKMAVVVQEMVPAKVAGVMFTANVVNNNTAEMLVNATWGWGETLVSGKVVPDTFILNKAPMSVLQMNLGDKHLTCQPRSGDRGIQTILEDTPQQKRKMFSLEQDTLFEIAQIGLDIEREMGSPQDIEWCIKPDGKLMILQTRPITTLNDRE